MPLPTRPNASVNLKRTTERPPLPIRLERHPLSAHFGDMPEDQWEELKADIKANKLKEEIVLYEGMVLDGWHRYKALCALGRPLSDNNSYEFDGTDPEKWVHSKNLFRRQLTAEERVRIAAKHLGYENTGRGGIKSGPSIKDVAVEAKVSLVTARRALEKPKAHDERLTPEAELMALTAKKEKLEKQLAEITLKIVNLRPAPIRGRVKRSGSGF